MLGRNHKECQRFVSPRRTPGVRITAYALPRFDHAPSTWITNGYMEENNDLELRIAYNKRDKTEISQQLQSQIGYKYSRTPLRAMTANLHPREVPIAI